MNVPSLRLNNFLYNILFDEPLFQVEVKSFKTTYHMPKSNTVWPTKFANKTCLLFD